MARSRWLPLAIVLVVAVVFGRIATHRFTWYDDNVTIHQNPRLNPPTFDAFRHAWTTADNGEYLPVTRTAWALLAMGARLSEPDPHYLPATVLLNDQVFHLASILVHAGAALAAYALLLRLVRKPYPAFWAALLFAVHPVQVESVAWASGLKDLLCGLFALLALWQYVAFVQARQHEGTRPWAHHAAATACFILSVLSKPAGVVVPALAVVIDLLVLRRPWKRSLRELAPWLVAAGAFAIVARALMPSGGIPTTPLWTRPLIVGDTVAFYLAKLAWPATLGLDYGRRPAAVMAWPGVWVAWLAPAALLAWTTLLAARRGATGPLAALLLLVLAIGPTLGFTPHMFQYFSTTADHYLYLAMIGPAYLLAWLMTLPRRGFIDGRELAIALVAPAVLLALAVRSIFQAGHWADDGTFWAHNLKVNERSFLSHVGRGAWAERQGRAGEAEAHYRRAIELNPDYAPPREAMTALLLARAQVDEAIVHLREHLRIVESFPEGHRAPTAASHQALGRLLLARGRHAEAQAHLRRARQLDPTLPAVEGDPATRPATLPATAPVSGP